MVCFPPRSQFFLSLHLGLLMNRIGQINLSQSLCSLLRIDAADNRRRYHSNQPQAITFHKQELPPRTLLIKIISPLLFLAPDRYFTKIEFANPNDFWLKNEWPQFIASLEGPWSDFTLYVRLLLF